MPRLKRFTYLLLLLPLAVRGQVLTNDGATLFVQPGATLVVGGTLLNRAGSTLRNEGQLLVRGDLINAATLTSTGRLVFAGSAAQLLTPGTATISRLQLSNTGPAGGGQNVLTVNAALTVADSLILRAGLVRTAPGIVLYLAPAGVLVGEAGGRYVQGLLRTSRPAVSGPVDFGLGLTLDATGQNLGTVTVLRAAGLQTADVSYGQNVGGSARGIDRIWTVSSSQSPTAPLPLTLSWLPDDDNGLTDFSRAQAWRQDAPGAPWAQAGLAQDATGTRRVAASAAALGRFTVSNAANPLPVELVRFTAEPLGADALLKWTTASEKNNERFEVEASTDGRAFQRIGQVPGHGSSTQPHEYQLVDPAIARYAASVVYYRLRQVDADGTASYSPVRLVAVSGQPGLALFPNPTTTTAATTLTGALPSTAVTVFDAVGRQVLAATADATGTAVLRLPAGQSAGVYVVRNGSVALRLVVE